MMSVGYDGTKVPPALQLDPSQKVIMGAVCSDHMIDILQMTDGEIKAFLDKNSSLKRPKEIKVALVSIQDAPPRMPPYFVLGAQPQSLNMISLFNERVASTIIKMSKEDRGIGLSSVYDNGVGWDIQWVM